MTRTLMRCAVRLSVWPPQWTLTLPWCWEWADNPRLLWLNDAIILSKWRLGACWECQRWQQTIRVFPGQAQSPCVEGGSYPLCYRYSRDLNLDHAHSGSGLLLQSISVLCVRQSRHHYHGRLRQTAWRCSVKVDGGMKMLGQGNIHPLYQLIDFASALFFRSTVQGTEFSAPPKQTMMIDLVPNVSREEIDQVSSRSIENCKNSDSLSWIQ